MTINPSAWILLAMYVALAQKQGYDLDKLSGTIQADILKEYQAQKEWAFPVAPSVRIVRDCITYCARNMKRYNPINISGYHISEAGGSPLDEVAFTMCNLITYVEEVLKTGMHVDEFAPRLAFFYVCQSDFFEEIAKFRAVRRVYAKLMRERFGARNPESMRLRFHCQTAAASLTKPQYQINVVRTGLQALAAVLGGAQSLHTNGMDEAFAIPTEEAMRIALRTQQIIAARKRRGERGRSARRLVLRREPHDTIRARDIRRDRRSRPQRRHDQDDAGRLVPAADRGFRLRHGAAGKRTAKSPSSASTCTPIRRKSSTSSCIHTMRRPPSARSRASQRVRSERDNAAVEALLTRLIDVAKNEDENIMPITIELVAAGATMGDIIEKLKTLWGTYRENPVF